MKSITSRSLLPALSCSRIWLRSSCARLATRFSSAAFSCEKAGKARKSTTRSLATLRQLLDQRAHLLLDDLRRERPDALVADDALAVDHVGLGHAVDAVVDRD